MQQGMNSNRSYCWQSMKALRDLAFYERKTTSSWFIQRSVSDGGPLQDSDVRVSRREDHSAFLVQLKLLSHGTPFQDNRFNSHHTDIKLNRYLSSVMSMD